MQILQIFTRWHWGCFALLLSLVIAAYGESWLSLNGRWNTRGEAYSHGYLLLVVALWFAFRHRRLLTEAPLQTGWLAFPLLLGASLFWLIGKIVDVQIAQQMVLPAIPFLVVWGTLGWRAASFLLFPVILLYTVIPFWDVLTPYLQAATVLMSGSLLGLLDVPAHITGLYIQLPAGVLQVAEGCAGLSYLLISITLALIYAQFFTRAWHKRASIVLVGVLMGLTSNWLRVFGIALIAHYSDMKSSMVKDHELFGWAIFAVCLVPFFFVVYRLEDKPASPVSEPPNPPMNDQRSLPSTQFVAMAPLVLIIALVGPMTAAWLESRPVPTLTIQMPEQLHNAMTIDLATQWLPAYHGADIQERKSYWVNSRFVTLIAFAYASQTQGKELVSWNNFLADGKAWKIHSQYQNQNQNFEISEISSNQERLQVFHWFNVGGQLTHQTSKAKLLQLRAVLAGRRDATLLAFAVKCQQTPCEPPSPELLAWLETSRAQASELIKINPAVSSMQ